MNSTKTMVLVFVLVVLAIGGFALLRNQKPSTTQEQPVVAATPETISANQLTVVLEEGKESSESGKATLNEVLGKVVVKLELTEAPKDTPQPAHIHTGQCPDVGDVKYPLTSPVNGMSETTLDVSMNQLKSEMPLAINVHKSAKEAKVYVACGDLPS